MHAFLRPQLTEMLKSFDESTERFFLGPHIEASFSALAEQVAVHGITLQLVKVAVTQVLIGEDGVPA